MAENGTLLHQRSLSCTAPKSLIGLRKHPYNTRKSAKFRYWPLDSAANFWSSWFMNIMKHDKSTPPDAAWDHYAVSRCQKLLRALSGWLNKGCHKLRLQLRSFLASQLPISMWKAPRSEMTERKWRHSNKQSESLGEFHIKSIVLREHVISSVLVFGCYSEALPSISWQFEAFRLKLQAAEFERFVYHCLLPLSTRDLSISGQANYVTCLLDAASDSFATGIGSFLPSLSAKALQRRHQPKRRKTFQRLERGREDFLKKRLSKLQIVLGLHCMNAL